MDDLIARLRNPKWTTQDGGTWLSAFAVDDMEEAADEIERLRAELRTAKQTIWMIVSSNGGYTLERGEMENYPGDDAAQMEWTTDPATGAVTFSAYQ